MGIAEDLERLKVADAGTWEHFNNFRVDENIFGDEALSYILQGCIQRAIHELPAWRYRQGNDNMSGRSWAVIEIDGKDRERMWADNPTDAILAAYLAAVEASK